MDRDAAQPLLRQRVRIRYARRGRMRFTSQRDFARAFERALRRAGAPVAYSAGFTPHPKVSYVGAAPTGAASEAEFVEMALREPVDTDQLRDALDAALPRGLDVVEVVDAASGGSLAERMVASRWRIQLDGVQVGAADLALKAFLDSAEVQVERLTKSGRRQVDVRAAVLAAQALDTAGGSPEALAPCAILELVVRNVTPSVRPDDVLAGLRAVAAFEPPVPARATRLEQGPLDETGRIADPLAADRQASVDAGPAL